MATSGAYNEDGSLRVTIAGNQSSQTAIAGGFGTNKSLTVGTTAVTLFDGNPLRTRLIIKNDTANDLWINFNGTAVAAAGSGNYKIAANGGYFELQGYTGSISAIASSAGTAISAREF